MARRQILDAALAVFARRGFEGTSVNDIARRANTESRTVFWHFGDKTRLYAHAVQLAGDRFLYAMRGQLGSRRATLAETLAAWVWTLEKGGDASVLVCAGSGVDWNPSIARALESLNVRLVEFWQCRLDQGCHLPESRTNRLRKLAQLIVAVAPAFALAREGPTLVKSALVADFAAALECVALDHDGDQERQRLNGSGSVGAAVYATRDRLRGANGDDRGSFSPREFEVLLEVEKGISNKEIARALGMTEHTVKFHLKNIFRKLGVGRRTEALKAARELRVI